MPMKEMPREETPRAGMPSGALALLILRVLQSGPLHGYAIAQRIYMLSSEVLAVEEGSLYPALQKLLLKGWASAKWGVSETNRKVRFYRLTAAGKRQLEEELAEYERVTAAIQSVLRTA
jgi:PadR family transcriptional regulator, regulatory protein PadR